MSAALKSQAKNLADILETASDSGSLKMFVTAVKAADLSGALKSGPLTVFAPSDKAFEALPPGTLDRLLKPEHRDELVRILKHHVLSGEVMSEAIRGKKFSRKSFAATEVTIDGEDNIKVNGAHIVTADIGASNGVIHIIDAVIMPPKA
jgi:uncharacterized surface protein with fasciclin (FAS1) repeats